MPFASCIFSTSFCLFPSLFVQFHSFVLFYTAFQTPFHHRIGCRLSVVLISLLFPSYWNNLLLWSSTVSLRNRELSNFFSPYQLTYLCLIFIDTFLTEFTISTATFSFLPFWCYSQLGHSMIIHPKVSHNGEKSLARIQTGSIITSFSSNFHVANKPSYQRWITKILLLD